MILCYMNEYYVGNLINYLLGVAIYIISDVLY